MSERPTEAEIIAANEAVNKAMDSFLDRCPTFEAVEAIMRTGLAIWKFDGESYQLIDRKDFFLPAQVFLCPDHKGEERCPDCQEIDIETKQ